MVEEWAEQETSVEASGKQHSRLYLSPAFTLISCSAYSSTLKLEAKYFYEILVDF
jgi:hypothetical protein